MSKSKLEIFSAIDSSIDSLGTLLRQMCLKDTYLDTFEYIEADVKVVIGKRNEIYDVPMIKMTKTKVYPFTAIPVSVLREALKWLEGASELVATAQMVRKLRTEEQWGNYQIFFKKESQDLPEVKLWKKASDALKQYLKTKPLYFKRTALHTLVRDRSK